MDEQRDETHVEQHGDGDVNVGVGGVGGSEAPSGQPAAPDEAPQGQPEEGGTDQSEQPEQPAQDEE